MSLILKCFYEYYLEQCSFYAPTSFDSTGNSFMDKASEGSHPSARTNHDGRAILRERHCPFLQPHRDVDIGRWIERRKPCGTSAQTRFLQLCTIFDNRHQEMHLVRMSRGWRRNAERTRLHGGEQLKQIIEGKVLSCMWEIGQNLNVKFSESSQTAETKPLEWFDEADGNRWRVHPEMIKIGYLYSSVVSIILGPQVSETPPIFPVQSLMLWT
jgi:hypothetical protein